MAQFTRSKIHPVNFGLWLGSSPAQQNEIELGIKQLQSWGINPIVSPEVKSYATQANSAELFFLAGTDSQKARELKKALANRSLNAVLAIRGGYGCLRLLPLLDKLLPKKWPKNWIRKPLIGFSDVTVLQMYLWAKYKNPWIHSPMLTSPALYDSSDIETHYLKHCFTASQRSHNQVQIHKLKPELLPPKTKLPSKLLILGGNLASLATLRGTKWEPSVSSKTPMALFIEDHNEAPYRIDRLLQQLTHAPYMEACLGIICGHLSEQEKSLAVVKKWALDNNKWVASGLLAGHERPNLPIPMGVMVHTRLSSSTESDPERQLLVAFPNNSFE